MKKVTKELYGIYQGCTFEGGGCEQQLYLTIEKAREAVLGIISKKDDKDEWVERRPDYWDNGCFCIMIQTFYFEYIGKN